MLQTIISTKVEMFVEMIMSFDWIAVLKEAASMFLYLSVELIALFLVISYLVGLLQVLLTPEKIQNLLSSPHGKGYIIAALCGAITPFCSCSTIPFLKGLLRARAGFGPMMVFLFASPLLNPIIIGLFVVTFGLKVAVFYFVIALTVSVVAGIVLEKLGFERYVKEEAYQDTITVSCCSTPAPKEETSCCSQDKPEVPEIKETCCSEPKVPVQTSCCGEPEPKVEEQVSCCGSEPKAKVQASCCSEAKVEVQTSCCSEPKPEPSCCSGEKETKKRKISPEMHKAIWRSTWLDFKQVFPYLMLGIFIGSFIYGFVPTEFITKYTGAGHWYAIPIAAVIGIPLYIRAEAVIPLSAALVQKGMALGSVMALIIGSAGASLTEVILLKSIFKTPMIIAFLVVVLSMAMGAGFLYNWVFI